MHFFSIKIHTWYDSFLVNKGLSGMISVLYLITPQKPFPFNAPKPYFSSINK